MKFKETKLYTVLFTFIITFIFVFILAYANNMTEDQVKKNQELFQITAILDAMQVDYTNGDQAYEIYKADITALNITNERYTNVTIYSWGTGSDKKYAFVFTGDALWGSITGVICVDSSVTRTVGLSFIDQNETPGLGGRITESWFLDQWAGENMIQTNAEGNVIRKISVKPGRTDRLGDSNKNNAEVDGISGASLTSAGVDKAVNKSLPVLADLIGELANE